MPPGPVHAGPSPVIGELIVCAEAVRIAAGEAISSKAAPVPTIVPPTKSLRVIELDMAYGFPAVTRSGLLNFPLTNISPLHTQRPFSRDHRNRIRIGEGG